MNPTDWAKIEDGYGGDYGPRPANRKRTAMPADPNDFLMGGATPPPEDHDDDPPFVTAKYDGRCSACGEFHILAGDTQIRADGDGGWEAEECAW